MDCIGYMDDLSMDMFGCTATDKNEDPARRVGPERRITESTVAVGGTRVLTSNKYDTSTEDVCGGRETACERRPTLSSQETEPSERLSNAFM